MTRQRHTPWDGRDARWFLTQSPNRLPPHDRWNAYDAGEFKHLRVGCFKAEGTDPHLASLPRAGNA
jgi:hypothetical protein